MKNNQKKASLQLLFVIATPKLADQTAELFKREGLPLQYRFHAEGTAPSEIMDMLGLGSIDKCVLTTLLPKSRSRLILKMLHAELQLDTVNSGIAFTMPLTGANSLVLRMVTKDLEETATESDRKEGSLMIEDAYVLIAAIVNRGFSRDVMEAAKSVGAKGGTVIPSRGMLNEDATGFWGMSVQEEQEIVLIIAEAADKVAIMQKVLERCGMHSEAQGIVISLPIDSALGL